MYRGKKDCLDFLDKLENPISVYVTSEAHIGISAMRNGQVKGRDYPHLVAWANRGPAVKSFEAAVQTRTTRIRSKEKRENHQKAVIVLVEISTSH